MVEVEEDHMVVEAVADPSVEAVADPSVVEDAAKIKKGILNLYSDPFSLLL
jgi:catabolite regulation protein CreA